MTALTYGELRLKSELRIKKITDVEISVTKNNHGLMKVEGIIDGEEDKDRVLEDIISFNVGRTISLHRDEEEIPIFSGLVERVKLVRRDNIDYVEVEVVSGTILMDREKKKRSFQDVNKTYEDIVKEVVSEYKDGATICTVGLEEKIGVPLIQYNETDWEFLKRISSHFESVIVPEVTQSMPRVWFGFPNTINTVEVDKEEYSYGQSEDYFKMGGIFSDYEPEDFRYVEVKGYDTFELGDFTVFDGQGYVLYERKGKMDRGELIFTYRFGAEGHRHEPRYYNEQISGMSLLGEVSKTDKETVGVKLDIDNGKGGEYLYDWRPETGNMMYCMPQVGTKVSLYFPGVDEREAIVVNCFRTNGDSCEKMKDPSKRAFATEHNKELTLYPKEMGISSGSGSSILISDEKGIDFNSKKSIRIIGSEINFSAPIINIKASIGEINLFKIDGNNELIRSSFTMSNEFNLMAEGGTTLVGREFTEYKAFDDEPERGSFWGGLVENVLGGLVAVGLICATIATLGAGGAVILGAAIGGATAVGMLAASDIRKGELGSRDSYLFAGLSGAVTGAISSGIFKLKLNGKIKNFLLASNQFIEDISSNIVDQMSDGRDKIDFSKAILGGVYSMLTGLGMSQLMKFKQFRTAFEMINNPLYLFKKNKNSPFGSVLGLADGEKKISKRLNKEIMNRCKNVKKTSIKEYKQVFNDNNNLTKRRQRELQKLGVEDFYKKRLHNADDHEYGNFAEAITDMYYESRGYSRIGTRSRITKIDSSTHQSIDAIYESPNPPPQYLIVEIKFNKSTLNNTKNSKRQMSNYWATEKNRGKDKEGKPRNRILECLGDTERDKYLAGEIEAGLETGNTQKIVTEVKIDGVRNNTINPGDILSKDYSEVKFNHFKVDDDGYIIKTNGKRHGRKKPHELPNFKGDDKNER